MDRSARPPPVSEADGRVAGARRAPAPAPGSRPRASALRPAARESGPGASAVLRNRDPVAGVATPVLVESHEGPPTKIEGNPEHPASLGATTAHAGVDPRPLRSRSRQDVHHRRRRPPLGRLPHRDQHATDGAAPEAGCGLRILTETITSPTIAAQLSRSRGRPCSAKWHQCASRRGAWRRTVEASTTSTRPTSSLRSTPISSRGPGRLRYARDFAARAGSRRRRCTADRLYAVESSPTLTGAKADHRLPLRVGESAAFAHGRGSVRIRTAEFRAALADLQPHAARVDRDRRSTLAGRTSSGRARSTRRSATSERRSLPTPVELRPVDRVSLRDLTPEMATPGRGCCSSSSAEPGLQRAGGLQVPEGARQRSAGRPRSLSDDDTRRCATGTSRCAPARVLGRRARLRRHRHDRQQPLIAPLYDGRTAHEISRR